MGHQVKVLAFLALLAVECLGAYLGQRYVLPRIGLHALTFWQVCIAVALVGPFQFVGAFLSSVVED